MPACVRTNMLDVASLTRGPLTVLEAVTMAHAYYYRPQDLEIVNELHLEAEHVYGAIVRHKGELIAILKGTVERAQWRLYNLAFWPCVQDGDTRRWHRGFLRYGQVFYAWLRDKTGISCLVGHSLGSAGSQIAGPALNLPTIALASPQPLYCSPQPERAHLVLNVCRLDDTIAGLPPSWWGFAHVGQLAVFDPAESHRGEDHRTPHLADALTGKELGVWSWRVPPVVGPLEEAKQEAGVS